MIPLSNVPNYDLALFFLLYQNLTCIGVYVRGVQDLAQVLLPAKRKSHQAHPLEQD